MFLARLYEALQSKADKWYVTEGGRLKTRSKNFTWKAIQLKLFILLFDDA
jgi:hypothetical protein